jgi:NADH dehydrogenase FAD-containing subunit
VTADDHQLDLFHLSPADQAIWDAGVRASQAAPPMSPERAARVGALISDGLRKVLRAKSE